MKIVIADDMESEVIEGIKKLGTVVYKPADLKKELTDAEVLIVRSATKVTAELIANADKLKIVARAGVGLDNVDKTACDAKGIKVINTPGASSNAVAELVIGVMISMLRNVQKAHFQMKNKIWDKKKLTGNEIAGKTLGVVGYGRIGAMTAEKAMALGMKIIAYDPKAKQVPNVKFVGLDELYANADIISLHTVLVPETKGMINKDTIAKMKKTVWIVNAARGELINEDDLYEACKSGRITGVAIDVYSKEPYDGKLLELDNVCFTPHLGASTKEAQARIGVELVEKLGQELKS
jgi:D-3-phosphoglycerate dehydrogenase